MTPDLLSEQPFVAYDETLPLIRPFFAAVFGTAPQGQAVAIAHDLRIVLRLVASGMGWTVLPDYLCREALGKHPASTAGQGCRVISASPKASVPRQAALARAELGRLAFQFQGSSSSRRLAGWSGRRARTSASQACGSTSLSLAVSISV